MFLIDPSTKKNKTKNTRKKFAPLAGRAVFISTISLLFASKQSISPPKQAFLTKSQLFCLKCMRTQNDNFMNFYFILLLHKTKYHEKAYSVAILSVLF